MCYLQRCAGWKIAKPAHIGLHTCSVAPGCTCVLCRTTHNEPYPTLA